MLKLIGLLAVLVAVIVVIGLYFDWFSFSSKSRKVGGKDSTDMTLNVNEDKLKNDVKIGK